MTITTLDYHTEIERWREQIEAPLRRDWVGLAGRFELEPGVSRIGTDRANEIVLPEGSAPSFVGNLHFDGDSVTLMAAPGVELCVNGKPLEGAVTLRSDAHGAPDTATLNALTFFVIKRGPRTIIRLNDANSPALQRWKGRRWFPVTESYHIEGVFTPYDPPKPLAITNILGDTSSQTSPGRVTFTLNGTELHLDATGWRDGGLLLHFRDSTNGTLTYGGGRSLITTPPEGGLVQLDFNRTTNLPCAFSAYATCPLPPQQNKLSIPVEAGELLPE